MFTPQEQKNNRSRRLRLYRQFIGIHISYLDSRIHQFLTRAGKCFGYKTLIAQPQGIRRIRFGRIALDELHPRKIPGSTQRGLISSVIFGRLRHCGLRCRQPVTLTTWTS